MKNLEIEIYGKPGKKFFLDCSSVPDDSDYVGTYEVLGYMRIRIAPPLFYAEKDDCLVELLKFKKRDEGSIISLWDSGSGVFEFYCENDNAELELICKLTGVMKDITQSELAMVKLHKEADEYYEKRSRCC